MTTPTPIALTLAMLCALVAGCAREPAEAGPAPAGGSTVPPTPVEERDGAPPKRDADASPATATATETAPAGAVAATAGAGTSDDDGGSDGDAGERKRECRDETRPREPGDEDLPPCAPGGALHLGPWRVRGGENDFRVDTVVCTFAKPFDLASEVGITMHFSGGARGGTYTSSGVAAGVTWSGGGSYTISGSETDRSDLFIAATGTSTIDSPMGRFSDSVTPTFFATPAKGACRQGG